MIDGTDQVNAGLVAPAEDTREKLAAMRASKFPLRAAEGRIVKARRVSTKFDRDGNRVT
jgi:hypothetical protein